MDEVMNEEGFDYDDVIDAAKKALTPTKLARFKKANPENTPDVIINKLDVVLSNVSFYEEEGQEATLQQTAEKYLDILLMDEISKQFARGLLEETPTRPGMQNMTQEKMEEYLDLLAKNDLVGLIKFQAENCKVYMLPQSSEAELGEQLPITKIEAQDFEKIGTDKLKELEEEKAQKDNSAADKELDEEKTDENEMDRDDGTEENSKAPESIEDTTQNAEDATKSEPEQKNKTTDYASIMGKDKKETEKYLRENPENSKAFVVSPKPGVDQETFLLTVKDYSDKYGQDVVVKLENVYLRVKDFTSINELKRELDLILAGQETAVQMNGDSFRSSELVSKDAQTDGIVSNREIQDSKTAIKTAEQVRTQEATDTLTPDDFLNNSSETEVVKQGLEDTKQVDLDYDKKMNTLSGVTQNHYDKIGKTSKALLDDGKSMYKAKDLNLDEVDNSSPNQLGPKDDHDEGR